MGSGVGLPEGIFEGEPEGDREAHLLSLRLGDFFAFGDFMDFVDFMDLVPLQKMLFLLDFILRLCPIKAPDSWALKDGMQSVISTN